MLYPRTNATEPANPITKEAGIRLTSSSKAEPTKTNQGNGTTSAKP